MEMGKPVETPEMKLHKPVEIAVDRSVMSRLMMKGEAYSQIKQILDSQSSDSLVMVRIRDLIKTTDTMML